MRTRARACVCASVCFRAFDTYDFRAFDSLAVFVKRFKFLLELVPESYSLGEYTIIQLVESPGVVSQPR